MDKQKRRVRKIEKIPKSEGTKLLMERYNSDPKLIGKLDLCICNRPKWEGSKRCRYCFNFKSWRALSRKATTKEMTKGEYMYHDSMEKKGISGNP